MDKGTVAIKNLNLIQNEVKTINNTLLELEKNIKNDSNLLKDVEKKNTKVLTELVSIATKIFKKMEHIIDEIQKIHSPGFWSTILDKLLLAAIAGAGGSLIVVVGTYLYEQYQTRRRLSILEKI
jgi:hypothetical protein